MRNSKIIGGEFEIRPEFIKNLNLIDKKQSYTSYSSGRAALFSILESIGKNVILIPDYICHSVIDTAERASYNILIYSLDDKFNPDYKSIESLYSGSEVVLIVNYFGLLDSNSIISKLQSIDNKMTIVLDNVQSPYAMLETSDADYSFTSFRKSFPTPDGAWAVSKSNKLIQYKNNSSFYQYKVAGNILKGLNFHSEDFDRIYLELLEKGEALIDDDYHTDMSDLSKYIVNDIDWKRIGYIRQRNANFLIKGMKNIGIMPMIEYDYNKVPLFIPFQFKNRDKVRKALFENKIFCPVHWPLDGRYKLERGKELSDTELSIIIDQRYNINDMLIILNTIEHNI